MIPRGPWQNAVPPPDISTSDGDLLGLRCISQYIILHTCWSFTIPSPEDLSMHSSLQVDGARSLVWWNCPLKTFNSSKVNLLSLRPDQGVVCYFKRRSLFHPTSNISLHSLLPPSSSQGSSFLQSSHRGAASQLPSITYLFPWFPIAGAHDLFGGLGLGSTSEFQSILGLPRWFISKLITMKYLNLPCKL